MRPRFEVGDRVTVVDIGKRGHVRTPSYIMGKTGRVIQFCGVFLNPEDLAVGNTGGPVVPLYRVIFEQSGIWPGYGGAPGDTLAIELYDHWLAPAADGREEAERAS